MVFLETGVSFYGFPNFYFFFFDRTVFFPIEVTFFFKPGQKCPFKTNLLTDCQFPLLYLLPRPYPTSETPRVNPGFNPGFCNSPGRFDTEICNSPGSTLRGICKTPGWSGDFHSQIPQGNSVHKSPKKCDFRTRKKYYAK